MRADNGHWRSLLLPLIDGPRRREAARGMTRMRQGQSRPDAGDGDPAVATVTD
jgi:hypothetical protein